MGYLKAELFYGTLLFNKGIFFISQIGQPVVPGHPLGVPIQMPLQHAGVPGSHLVAVTSAQGQNVTFIGGLSPGQMAPRLANATDTTPSRPGAVMSPVCVFYSGPFTLYRIAIVASCCE